MRTTTTTSTAGTTRRPSGTAALVTALVAALPSCNGDTAASTPWSLGTETQTMMIEGPNAAGEVLELRCPENSVAIGYDGRAGQWIDQIRLRCAELKPDGTLGIITTSGTLGTSAGGVPSVTDCPLDAGVAPTAVVGDRGALNDWVSYGYIGSIEGQCQRPGDIAGGAVNSAATLTTEQLGAGGIPHELFCPDGSAVTGLRGRVGKGYVAAIGYFCREVRDG